MGLHTMKVPDLGEGIAEVELMEWLVKPGDRVAEDQPLALVMTDKASVEIPSPVVGTVVALGGEVGKMLAVGSELIRIEVEGEVRAARGSSPTAPASPPLPLAEKRSSFAEGSHRGSDVTPAPEGRGDRPSQAAHLPPSPLPLSRPAGEAKTLASSDLPIASPALRRRAWELGVDLKDIVPSGPGGRIMQGDLDAHIARHGTKPPSAPAPATAAPRDDTETITIAGVRRRIAVRMQDAKRRIPHFAYVEEVDVTELLALREQLNERFGKRRPRLTLLPFIARAIVRAVAAHPQVNATFDDEKGIVTRHGAVHLGVATQTGNGLMVPVLRQAQTLDLWQCAAEIARLADAARGGRATRAELTGSTITLTSLGALGGIASTPIINAPEVAIVGVNRVVERPAWRGGTVVPRQLMNLSSSFDHRVVDGADAAAFVQAMRAALEMPATLFVG